MLTGSDKTLDEWEEPLGLAYVAYGYADANGDRSIDIFLREHSRDLEAAEGEALAALQKTGWPSLFEVQEVQARFLGPIMQKHIDSWIDEKIPALDGKTPRQAVKTKAGRDKVVAMLKDQENSMQRHPAAKLVDFSGVYRELGLAR